MSRDIEKLDDDFKIKVKKLLTKCENLGYKMIPFYTIRDVYDQSKLWRQSRSFSEIKTEYEMLKTKKAFFLADVLMGVGAQSGKWATNATAGFSWHQHGNAIDCYWKVGNKAEWSNKKLKLPEMGDNFDPLYSNNPQNGYFVYATEAQNLGLVSGHFWRKRDSVHIQKDNKSVSNLIRSGILTWQELDSKMESMYSR